MLYCSWIHIWPGFDANICRHCSFVINMNIRFSFHNQEQSAQVEKSTGTPHVNWSEKIWLKIMLTLMRDLTVLWRYWMQYGNNGFQIKLALPSFSHAWMLIIKFPYPIQLALLIILHSQHPFLLIQIKTMATQSEPVMARAIRVLGKCDSSHRLHPSVGLFSFRVHWTIKWWVSTAPHC